MIEDASCRLPQQAALIFFSTEDALVY